MTNQEAIEELQLTIDLIKQNGKDWLDESDIPILSMAIEAMKELNALREQNSSSQMSGTSDAEFWKKRALEYSKTCCDLLARLSNGTKVDSIQLNENGISFHMSTQSEQNLPTQMSGTSEDAVSRNAIIQKLNTMDRYVSEELRLCDTEKRFPKNEVFIVDDVYEEIVESLPSVQPEIINCENCKHCNIYCDNEGNEHHSCKINFDENGFWNEVMNDDFCSMAERRTDE